MTSVTTKLIAAAITIALALFAFNWFVSYERDIGYQKRVAEDAVQLNKDLIAARADTERLFRIADAAEMRGIEREKDLIAKRAAADAVAAGLRNDIAIYRSSLPSYSIDTARAYADTGLRLLGACQERYLEVAAAAKGHQSDRQTVNEAWPK